MKSTFAFLVTLSLVAASDIGWADQPCDRYPASKQRRCETLWKQINDEAIGEMAQFGTDQLKRREEGKITAEQHLKENMAFIKQSGERRLKLLGERMEKEK
ncbi:MAG TPA: hypothetical protein VJ692_04350 [Nitrospiraceae bacterium]|nr:hypothetical protein [Nitrospiraceae bacterium]